MRFLLFSAILLCNLLLAGSRQQGFVQIAQAQTSSGGSGKPAAQLDHFDPKNVDSSIDACTDFYQYSCKRWIAANPAPPDEVFWGASGKLQLWNTAVLRQTVLAVAAKPAAVAVVASPPGN